MANEPVEFETTGQSYEVGPKDLLAREGVAVLKAKVEEIEDNAVSSGDLVEIISKTSEIETQLLDKASAQSVTALTSQLAETGKQSLVSITSKVTHEDVTYSEFRSEKYGTSYSITTIPYKGVDGKVYKPQVGFIGATLNAGLGKPSDFAKRENALLTVNGGAYFFEHVKTGGMFIKDGIVLQEYDYLNDWDCYVLGIKSDNLLKAYPKGTPSTTLLGDGVVNALTGFVPMIENGVITSDSVMSKCVHWNDVNPRQVIAQMPNKDILFFTCSGRSTTERGMKLKEVVDVLMPLGVTFAYNLDGGGSSTVVIKNKKTKI